MCGVDKGEDMEGQYFDSEGDMQRYGEFCYKLGNGVELCGEEAAVFLAEEFAGKTHGNYCAETLHRRSMLHKQYKITIEKL